MDVHASICGKTTRFFYVSIIITGSSRFRDNTENERHGESTSRTDKQRSSPNILSRDFCHDIFQPSIASRHSECALSVSFHSRNFVAKVSSHPPWKQEPWFIIRTWEGCDSHRCKPRELTSVSQNPRSIDSTDLTAVPLPTSLSLH